MSAPAAPIPGPVRGRSGDPVLPVWHDEVAACTLTAKDRRWLAVAAKAAARSMLRCQVGAVAVRGGTPVALGWNRARNTPGAVAGRYWRCSEHAEVALLRQLGDPVGVTVYVVRLGRDGRWRYARPCLRCQAALDAAGVGAVVWSSPGDDGTLPAVAVPTRAGARRRSA